MPRASVSDYLETLQNLQQLDYRWWLTGSTESADVAVPLILEATNAQSVADVGCGLGQWLAAFKRLGVEDVLGYDGPWVDRSQLFVAPPEFVGADLNEPLPVCGGSTSRSASRSCTCSSRIVPRRSSPRSSSSRTSSSSRPGSPARGDAAAERAMARLLGRSVRTARLRRLRPVPPRALERAGREVVVRAEHARLRDPRSDRPAPATRRGPLRGRSCRSSTPAAWRASSARSSRRQQPSQASRRSAVAADRSNGGRPLSGARMLRRLFVPAARKDCG